MSNLMSQTLLDALGSYWEDYFEDKDTLLTTTEGALSLVSQEYSKLVDMALSSSLTTLPVDKALSYDLILIPENALTQVEEGHYTLKYNGLKDIEYLSNSLFEPEVTLEHGVDFSIADGVLHLYVDLFDDEGINRFLYRSDDIYQRHVVLWGTNIVLQENWVYDKYGVFLYNKEPDSADYRDMVSALLYFYVNTKSIGRIEAVVNILFGAPFSRHSGEIVQEIKEVDALQTPHTLPGVESYYRILTDFSEYYCPSFFTLNIEVGEELRDFKILGKLNTVHDYISDPDWYKEAIIPADLFKDVAAMDGFEDEQRRQYIYHTGLGSYSGNAIHNNITFKEWAGSFNGPPPSVHRLAPEKYQPNEHHHHEINTFNGTYQYNSSIKHHTLRGFYQYVYSLVDQILKHNLLYFKNYIPVQNYSFYDEQKMMFIETIRSGIPVYLKPIIEFILTSEEEDTLYTLEDGELLTQVNSQITDYYSDNRQATYMYQGAVLHEGSILHNNSPFYAQDTLKLLIADVHEDRQTADDGDLSITVLDTQGNIIETIPEQNSSAFFRRHTGWDHSGNINYYGGK